ncbi:MAG: DUF302 domain-containing protein [Pseudomonadota bacterium]
MEKFLFGGIAALSLLACTEAEPASDGLVAIEGSSPSALIQDRFKIVESSLGHSGTLSSLLEALDRRDLMVFAMIDHAASAENIEMELDASTLVIFGNPRGGTPLLQAEPLLGAELPLRALIYQEGDQVYLAITGIDYLERQYGLSDHRNVTENLREMVSAIAVEATQL